jgi:hypothetical protein
MSVLSVIANGALNVLQKFVSKSTVVAQVGDVTVTAGGLESAAGSLVGFISEFKAAIAAKNYRVEAELGIDEALLIAADLGVPYAGLADQIVPFIFDLINSGQIQIGLGDLAHNAGEQQSQIIHDRFGR